MSELLNYVHARLPRPKDVFIGIFSRSTKFEYIFPEGLIYV